MATSDFFRRFCMIVLTIAAGMAALPASASATETPQPSEPILIKDCSLTQSYKHFGPVGWKLRIRFQNLRETAVDEVHFIVQYANQRVHIVDRGKFSQEVTIGHSFGPFFDPAYANNVQQSCTVDHVHFTDGTVWPQTSTPTTNPSNPPIPMKPAKAANMGANLFAVTALSADTKIR